MTLFRELKCTVHVRQIGLSSSLELQFLSFENIATEHGPIHFGHNFMWNDNKSTLEPISRNSKMFKFHSLPIDGKHMDIVYRSRWQSDSGTDAGIQYLVPAPDPSPCSVPTQYFKIPLFRKALVIASPWSEQQTHSQIMQWNKTQKMNMNKI